MLTYTSCRLCPRACRVDRVAGQRGFCGMPGHAVAARAAAHFGEEPLISGSFGSGTVFFSGCTLGCSFCQNEQISHRHLGAQVTTRRLREIFEELIDQGVQNINLVTATQFLPSILPALEPKLPVPVVYNCGGYESVETLRALEGKIDVYLPDFKFSDGPLAARLAQASDYPQVAAAAILEMFRQTGPCLVEDDQLRRGVLVRHLLLPGAVDNSLRVVSWFAEHFPGGEALFSLMAQYTPMGRAGKFPPLDRTVTEEEYAAVCSWMDLCGVESGYIQDLSAAGTDHIPDFTGEGL